MLARNGGKAYRAVENGFLTGGVAASGDYKIIAFDSEAPGGSCSGKK